MADPVFIIRGVPGSVDDMVRAQAQSSFFIGNAKKLATIDEDRVRAAGDALDSRSQEGFLDQNTVRTLLTENFGDEDLAKTAAHFIRYCDRTARDSDSSPSEIISKIETAIKEDPDASLSDEDATKFLDRLRILVKDRPALTRQRKAEQLATSIGHPLEEVQIICDLRPVFDPNRKDVEGVVPVTTLKIVVTGENGLPMRMEARLTASQVADLADKSAKAKSKLEALRDFVAEKKVDCPKID